MSWAMPTAVTHAQVTLGSAASFGILIDGGSVTVGNASVMGGYIGADDGNVTLGNNSTAPIVLADTDGNGTVITLGNYTNVLQCGTDSGGTISLGLGAQCFSTDTSGGSIGILENAENDEETFENAAQCATVTQPLSAISLADGKKMTITDTVSGGLNVISVPSITLNNSSTLTLSGGSTDTVVLLDSGVLSIGSGAKIVLTGGLVPANVYINADNSGTWGNSIVLSGTLEVEDNGCTVGSGAVINGALICENDTTIGPNLRLNFSASAVSVPGCYS